MGSGSKRRQRDRPQTKIQKGAGGSVSESESISCPRSFTTPLSKGSVEQEITLSLKRKGDEVFVMAGSDQIKQLSSSEKGKIMSCLEKFRYVGKAVKKKSRLNGEFLRKE